jgi:SHS family lactate transporter-like MFS transporter
MEITSMIMSEMEGTSVNTPILPLFLNFGSIVGNILLPYIAEKKGRSPAYKVSGAISLLGSLCLVVFGHPYILYLGLFGVGTGMGADMIICYTVLLESIPPSTSNRALTWTSTGWSLGTPLCILIAYLVKDVFKLEIMSWRVMVYFGLVCQLYFTIERIKINETPVYLFEKADSRFSNVLKNVKFI